MNVRVIVTVVVLSSFPALVAAQTPPPRLDLTRLNHPSPVVTPTPRPFTLAVPTVRRNQFAKPPAPRMSCDESTALGRFDGQQKPFSKWFFTGLGAGFGTSWFGFIWAPGLARGKTRAPKVIPVDVDEACYTAGFLKTAKLNSTMAAVLGTAIGAVLLQTFFIGWS